MLTRDRVLAVLRMRGPSIPVHIKKAVGQGDTFMVGALLSELVKANKARVTTLKRGGSPFYYVPEHASKLENLIPELGEKDQRVAQLLRSEKVLRDKTQDPLTRVSLRQIKDFAVPLDVRLPDGQEIFWKWYLTSREEAEGIIKKLLGIQPEPIKKEVSKKEPEVVVEKPPKADVPKPTKKVEKPVQKPLEEKTLKAVDDTDDPFYKQLQAFFKKSDIQVISKEIIRKNSDIELELAIPSAVGRLEYYCKAKNKKKCNDGDLSTAYLQGQMRKLPVLFLTTGDVTKKAIGMLQKEFKGLVLKQL